MHQLRCIVGTAHGWLFTTADKANLYLLKPITGARAALPPITTLHRVKSSFTDDGGGSAYNVECGLGRYPNMKQFSAQRARTRIYHRVTGDVSGSPLAATACVVLLTHMPRGELSFARTGDERWKLLSESDFYGGHMISTVYSEKDGLFYALRFDGSVHSLDLMNNQYPVMRLVKRSLINDSLSSPNTTYLAITPRGSLLLVTRFCRGQVGIFGQGNGNSEGSAKDDYRTTGIQVEAIDVRMNQTVRRRRGIKDEALFLGQNSALCLPIKESAVSMLKQICAYLTGDADKDFYQQHRDLVVWDFQRGTMQYLANLWPLHPRLDCPDAIWFTPSFC